MKATSTPPAITQELQKAVKAVLIAKCYADTIRPEIHRIQNEILRANNYHIRPEFLEERRKYAGVTDTRILDQNKAYLMPTEQHKEYCSKVHTATTAAGYLVDNPDFCPLLVAEANEREARRLMFEASFYIMAKAGTTRAVFDRLYYNLTKRREYEDIIISMVIAANPSEFTTDNLLNA